MNLSVAAVVGISIIALSLIMLLKQYRPEFALLVSVITACILLFYAIGKSGEIINTVNSLADRAGIDQQNIRLIFKALGICYLVQIAKDICRDSGQTALADRVDFIGKITIVGLSVPLLLQIVTMITELLV